MRLGVRYRYMGTQMLIRPVVSLIEDLLVDLCFPLGVLPSIGACGDWCWLRMQFAIGNYDSIQL